MKEGSVVLTAIQQADGEIKKRPAVVLRIMPRYNDLLVCGISSQLHQQVKGFDEIVSRADADFTSSGLLSESLIRLGFLSAVPSKDIEGSIGAISAKRHKRLLKALSDYLIGKRTKAKK